MSGATSRNPGRKSTEKSRHPGLDGPPGSLAVRTGGFKAGADLEKDRHPGRNRSRESFENEIRYKKSGIPYNLAGIRRRSASSAAGRGQEAASTGSASSTKPHPSVLQMYWTPCFLVT